MSDWERDANAALRALGDAWQQGGISRETYRERRRRMIAALRERRDETERHALPAVATAAPSHARRETGAAVMVRWRRGSPATWRWLALLATLAAAIAAVAWLVRMMEQGNA